MSSTREQQKLIMPFGLMFGRDVTDAQKVTAMWIVHYASKGFTSTCSASNKTLSICTGKSERQVRRDISVLCKQGYMTLVTDNPRRANGKSLYDTARYLKLTPKTFKMPKVLEEETAAEEISMPDVDLDMSGGEDMDVHLYKNNNNNYPLNNKTIALPSANAVNPIRFIAGPFVLGQPRKYQMVIGEGEPLVPPTRSFILGDGLLPAAAAPPPTGVSATPLDEIIQRVTKLPLCPRVRGMVQRLLQAGHPAIDILIRGSIVTLRKESDMKDDKRLPRHCSLDEILARSNEGTLHRKVAKPTMAIQVTALSRRLRELTGAVSFVADHTTKQLGQLKTFMRVVSGAGADPLDVLTVVAKDWNAFGYYMVMQGKPKPKLITPDPGVLAYLAGDCVNFYRQRGKVQAEGQQTMQTPTPKEGAQDVAGAHPAPNTTGSGIITAEEFLARVKAKQQG